jgi:hypothetical protein
MTKNRQANPPETERHLVSIDDDLEQHAAICSCGNFRFVSDDIKAKKLASYQHLAEMMTPRA